MNTTIRLVIADDHEIFRDGLALMLSKQDTVVLTGQAGDGEELLRLVADTRPISCLQISKCPGLGGSRLPRSCFSDIPT